MAEISSSQESLPLSQETVSNLCSVIPPGILEEFITGHFDGNSRVTSSETPDDEQSGATKCCLQTPNIVKTAHQISLPATEDFPGFFDFSVALSTSNNLTKQSPFVYSTTTRKLYVRRNILCPFHFSTSQPLNGYVIRATLYFSSPENAADVVVRCISDSFRDRDAGDPFYEHLLQCESRSALYYKDAIYKRCSVTVPFENPPIGQSHSTYLYKFTCFSSCSGGPNRRPMCVVFTLENKGTTLGRCKVDLKVCSGPYRDKVSDENHFKKQVGDSTEDRMSLLHISNENNLEVAKVPTKRKHEDKSSKEKEFIIMEEDEDCYKFLCGMLKYYELRKQITQKSNWRPTVSDVENILHVLSSEEEK